MDVLGFFRDYLQFILAGTHWEWAALAFVIGPLPILTHLLKTGHATFDSAMVRKGGCHDNRFANIIEIFGGSAGFGLGLFEYFLATQVWPNAGIFTDYTLGVAIVGFITTIVQVCYFTYQVVTRSDNLREVMFMEKSWPLLAHFRGCGWVTATGLGWWLYWIQWGLKKLTLEAGVIFVRTIRDIEVPIKWITSLPMMSILIIIFGVITRGLMYPWFEATPDHIH